MTAQYDHSQTAWAILLTVLVLALGFSCMLFLPPFKDNLTTIWWVFPMMGLLALLFYRGRTQVFKDKVKFSFGPGLISKTVSTNDISKLETITNPIVVGYGIRVTKYGWLYNVSGQEAVKITLKNGRHICFGTDDPLGLKNAINKSIRQL